MYAGFRSNLEKVRQTHAEKLGGFSGRYPALTVKLQDDNLTHGLLHGEGRGRATLAMRFRHRKGFSTCRGKNLPFIHLGAREVTTGADVPEALH